MSESKESTPPDATSPSPESTATTSEVISRELSPATPARPDPTTLPANTTALPTAESELSQPTEHPPATFNESTHDTLSEIIEEIIEPIAEEKSESHDAPAKANANANQSPTASSSPAASPQLRTISDNYAARSKNALRVRQSKRDAKLARIVEFARNRGAVRNDDIKRILRVSDATATRYARLLVQRGELMQHGKGRGVRYTART